VIHLRTEDEVDLIRRSARVVAGCLDHLETLVRPGVTTLELDRAAEEFVRAQGALPAFKGYRGYPRTLCVSVNETVVHGIPDGTVLKEGDIIGCDMGAIVEGYYGDSARTFPVGHVSPEAERLLEGKRTPAVRVVQVLYDPASTKCTEYTIFRATSFDEENERARKRVPDQEMFEWGADGRDRDAEEEPPWIERHWPGWAPDWATTALAMSFAVLIASILFRWSK